MAELHIEAGWAAFDGGLYDRAMGHYGHALKLGTEAGDAYCQAVALGAVTALGIPADEPRAVVVGENGRAAVQAQVLANSASALSRLDYPEVAQAADTAQAKAREPVGIHPRRPLQRPGPPRRVPGARPGAPGCGRAVRLGVSAPMGGRRPGTPHPASGVVRATIHVKADEPDGLRMAHGEVTAAARLTSVRVRRQLEPLVAALEARPEPRRTADWPGWPGGSPRPGCGPRVLGPLLTYRA